MQEYKAVMDENGRIVIPAKCRNSLHLTPGEIVVIRVQGEEARICSAKVAIEHAQKMVNQVTRGKKVLVNELIKSRRLETKNE